MRNFFITFLMLVTIPVFATGVSSTETAADCNESTLDTYTGTSNLSADWQANTIALHWYSDDTELTVPAESQSCTYDGTLTPPSTIPTKTGYTFKGWRVRGGLPAGYTRLESTESTGTQWIDTGYLITSSNYRNIKYETETSLANGVNNQWQCDGIGYEYPCLYIAKSHTNKLAFGYGNVSDIPTTRTLTQAEYTSIHKYVLDMPNGKGYFDDEEFSFTPVNTATFNQNFYIFTWNSGSWSAQKQNGKKRYARLWDNGVLVRNFIPAKRNSDDVVGMYDTVSETFFENAGTGEFIAGPEVSN